MSKQLRAALASTLEGIRFRHSLAESMLEGDYPEAVISYIDEIHAISYVGPTDYREALPVS